MSELPDWITRKIPKTDGVEKVAIVELFNKEATALEYAARPGPRIIESLKVGLPLSSNDYSVSWLRSPEVDEYKIAVSSYGFPGRTESVQQTLQSLTKIYSRDGKSRSITIDKTTHAYVVDLRNCLPLRW